MSRRAFTLEQRGEAIALSGMIGATAAAEQLGIDPRTVRKWSLAAGIRSTDYLEPTTWQRIHDASIARVDALIGTGRMTAVQLATVAAIAKRNLSAPVDRQAPPTDVEQAFDTFEGWISATYPTVDIDAALIVLLSDPRMDGPEPDDVMAHMRGILTDLLATHGSIEEVRKAQRADRQAAWQAQVEANGAAAQAVQHAIEQAETRDLLAAAEAFLARLQ